LTNSPIIFIKDIFFTSHTTTPHQIRNIKEAKEIKLEVEVDLRMDGAFCTISFFDTANTTLLFHSKTDDRAQRPHSLIPSSTLSTKQEEERESWIDGGWVMKRKTRRKGKSRKTEARLSRFEAKRDADDVSDS
jgi:hypothetical protein